MNKTLLGHGAEHLGRTVRMLFETICIFLLLLSCTAWALKEDTVWLLWVSILLQGFWLQRVYCVGHEASHQKLFPKRPKTNDTIGQIFLWLLLVPLPIFRKIHRFHHTSNRRDEQTSALDVYCVPRNANWLQKMTPYAYWYCGIALGGWFLHSLVSILFFLFLPLKVAQKVSPAFEGWKRRDQILSILTFSVPIVGHVALFITLGASMWLHLFAIPFFAFAMVYSIQLYVYHYQTSIGPRTLFHARRLNASKLIGWWLLNLNEHDTHHQRPKVVWYKLPDAGRPLPKEFAKNQNVSSFTLGIIQQFKGPTVVKT